MIGAQPFDGLPDPAAYVPRSATDLCLAALEDWAFDDVGGPAIAVLDGPPGIGKTLMLRMLETRARGRLECVYVSNPTFGPRELCISALDALGAAPGDDPCATFDRILKEMRREGSRVLMLIDDVELLHASTEDWLRRSALESKRNLLAVLAVADPAHCARLMAVFGGDARRISLSQPMERRETAAFVYAELARRGVPYPMVVHFDERALDAIHESAAGIPALVQQEAALRLRLHQEESDPAARPRALGAAIVSVGEGMAGPPVPVPVAVEPAATDRETPPAEALPSLGEALALLGRVTGRTLSVRSREAAYAIRAGLSHLGEGTAGAARELGARGLAVIRRLDTYPTGVGAGVVAGFVLAFVVGHWSGGRLASHADVAPSAAPAIADEPAEPAASAAAPVAPAIETPQPAVATPVALAAPTPSAPPAAAPPARRVGPPVSSPPRPRVATRPARVAPKTAPAKTTPAKPARRAEPKGVSAAPVPETLLVDVNARPWAVIWIDGRKVGETPLAEIPLTAGPHRIAAQLPDGRRVERDEKIGPDNRHLRFE